MTKIKIKILKTPKARSIAPISSNISAKIFTTKSATVQGKNHFLLIKIPQAATKQQMASADSKRKNISLSVSDIDVVFIG